MEYSFRIEFYGREAGAIGICYDITSIVQAENREAAIIKLYDDYEHIKIKKIETIHKVA